MCTPESCAHSHTGTLARVDLGTHRQNRRSLQMAPFSAGKTERLNATAHSGLDPGTEKGHRRKKW